MIHGINIITPINSNFPNIIREQNKDPNKKVVESPGKYFAGNLLYKYVTKLIVVVITEIKNNKRLCFNKNIIDKNENIIVKLPVAIPLNPSNAFAPLIQPI